MIIGPWRGDVVGGGVVRMRQPEILAVVEENLFARPNFAGHVNVDPDVASCRAYIGFIT